MVHDRPPAILPSLLACDLSNLASEANRVAPTENEYVHLDVMDGHFVPNLTWGAPVIQCLKKESEARINPEQHSKAFFDVHLMVSKPAQWVKDMKDAGAHMFTFHVEAVESEEETHNLIKEIRAAGMKVGIALKPNTPASAVFPFGDSVDLILVMTVEPGFGGQSFMENMMPKVAEIRAKYPGKDIEVDGGIGPGNIDTVAKAGANWIVAGSSVFKAADPKEVIGVMHKSVEVHGNGK